MPCDVVLLLEKLAILVTFSYSDHEWYCSQTQLDYLTDISNYLQRGAFNWRREDKDANSDTE